MIYYALTWRPKTDNLGHDLVALAAMQHLPRVDFPIDADALDQPLPHLTDGDRVVTLLCSHFLTAPVHWPPDEHIAPACAGVHISAEDAWGVPISEMSAEGLDALRLISPIAARDDRTKARLDALDIPCTVTGDITLTLTHKDVPRRGIVCCDVPEEVSAAIRRYRSDVTDVTHAMQDASPDFTLRMSAAQAMLDRYASAEMVFTRRLHCAMACLAVGTPVLWLYRPEYEDTARFAPMDKMVRRQSIDDFLAEITRHGLPVPWRNPADVAAAARSISASIRESLARAERLPLPLIPQEHAVSWRQKRMQRMMDVSAQTISRLESAYYAEIRAKFERLDVEDAAKDALTILLTQPEVRRALQEASLRMQLASLDAKEQKNLRARHRQGLVDVDDLLRAGLEALSSLGWPEENA